MAAPPLYAKIETPETPKASLHYLGYLFASLSVTLVLLAVALYWGHLNGTLPPMPVTASLSFNEKVSFVRSALGHDYDIIAAGSSMTLNNLSSEILTESFADHPDVLNIAAWNMKVGDTRRWLKQVLKHSHAKTVILVTGLMDFYGQESWLTVSDDDLNRILSAGLPSQGIEFIRNFSLQYYLENWPSMRLLRSSHAGYRSLDFDRGGAVPLKVYFPHVDPKRWNEGIKLNLINEEEYRQLSLLASDLRRQNIDFIVVQAPLRRVALAEAGSAPVQHWRLLNQLLREHEQRFIDLHDCPDFDDSFFADYSHLNAKGAATFTRALADQLRRNNDTR